jgi:hypothetical protein
MSAQYSIQKAFPNVGEGRRFQGWEIVEYRDVCPRLGFGKTYLAEC